MASPFDKLRVTPIQTTAHKSSVFLSLSKETRAKNAGEGAGAP